MFSSVSLADSEANSVGVGADFFRHQPPPARPLQRLRQSLSLSIYEVAFPSVNDLDQRAVGGLIGAGAGSAIGTAAGGGTGAASGGIGGAATIPPPPPRY